MAFLVLSVNGNSAFVWSSCNDLSGKTSHLFKIYTTGYETGTSCAEFCQYSAIFQSPEKTQEPTTTVTAHKSLKFFNGFLYINRHNFLSSGHLIHNH